MSQYSAACRPVVTYLAWYGLIAAAIFPLLAGASPLLPGVFPMLGQGGALLAFALAVNLAASGRSLPFAPDDADCRVARLLAMRRSCDEAALAMGVSGVTLVWLASLVGDGAWFFGATKPGLPVFLLHVVVATAVARLVIAEVACSPKALHRALRAREMAARTAQDAPGLRYA